MMDSFDAFTHAGCNEAIGARARGRHFSADGSGSSFDARKNTACMMTAPRHTLRKIQVLEIGDCKA